MAKRKVTLSLDSELVDDVDRACIDLKKLDRSDACEEALHLWLSSLVREGEKYRRGDGKPLIGGEFVKCPAHLRDMVNTAIVRLCTLDRKYLPQMEDVLIRLTDPAALAEAWDDRVERDTKRALSGIRPIPHKKNSA